MLHSLTYENPAGQIAARSAGAEAAVRQALHDDDDKDDDYDDNGEDDDDSEDAVHQALASFPKAQELHLLAMNVLGILLGEERRHLLAIAAEAHVEPEVRRP